MKSNMRRLMPAPQNETARFADTSARQMQGTAIPALQHMASCSPPVQKLAAIQRHASAIAPLQRAVIQRQRTDVCLRSASGTYTDSAGAQQTFTFRQGGKGTDVIANTKSHPNAMQDNEALAEKYLKKYGEIPKDATNVVFTACDTYGIKNR